MPILFNLACMLVVVRASFSALDVHSHKVYFPIGLFLFVNDHASLSFLKAILKGLKQATSRGWSA